MADLIATLDVEAVRGRLDAVRGRIADACARVGRDPDGVEVLVAVKYLEAAALPALADAGATLAGENRAQALVEKVAAAGADRLRWDFIGQLQSRKVAVVLPHVERIHSVASESVLARLERHADLARPGLEVLLQVDVAGEDAKAGIAPGEVAAYLERCPLPVVGLATMPPAVRRPQDNRRHFAALAELAAEHGLAQLSMGTSQDHEVAVEEGATVVRLGGALLR